MRAWAAGLAVVVTCQQLQRPTTTNNERERESERGAAVYGLLRPSLASTRRGLWVEMGLCAVYLSGHFGWLEREGLEGGPRE